ncbi:hypothetical protein [Shewanella psychropiezotolerans]|uniref:hypothetical protein n=1 Tax=Shewanella psychropiezotolerans TaxID=2593655 RepID=UPI001E54C282|nr:hypothetical protein [Shewanella psychropiezotolerans]
MATEDIELSQYNSIGATLHQQLDPNALVIIGLTIVPELDCDLELMIIATGIQAPVACSAVQVDAATLPPPKTDSPH